MREYPRRSALARLCNDVKGLLPLAACLGHPRFLQCFPPNYRLAVSQPVLQVYKESGEFYHQSNFLAGVREIKVSGET